MPLVVNNNHNVINIKTKRQPYVSVRQPDDIPEVFTNPSIPFAK